MIKWVETTIKENERRLATALETERSTGSSALLTVRHAGSSQALDELNEQARKKFIEKLARTG